ncbi:hypothetical protein B0H10DRAFT_2054914 [Mycena sp. CBHHK59/15]|nr:hypothetical protein B0H10DRAFT_2054914 [Mycena sp. CBHHK59/15]
MSSFTPTQPVNMANEKDWAANLGMLDWDATSIVFTKRTLMEFLKYTGTTVDTNFANIQKLPRYAKFGKISDSAGTPGVATVVSADPKNASFSSTEFKPTRRVRELPGGPRTDIFGNDDVIDALAMAPPKAHGSDTPTTSSAVPIAPPVDIQAAPAASREQTNEFKSTPVLKPSRRVREAPGGNSSVQNFWGSEEPEEFKPTRRVRQAPGGGTSGIF